MSHGQQQFFPAVHEFFGPDPGYFECSSVPAAFVKVHENKNGGKQNDKQGDGSQYG